MQNFKYLSSTTSNNLSLNTELNSRGKAASSMACLTKRVWENNMLTRNTKIQVYQALVLSTLLYCSESWTLHCKQELIQPSCGTGGVFVRYGRGVNGRKGEYGRMKNLKKNKSNVHCKNYMFLYIHLKTLKQCTYYM